MQPAGWQLHTPAPGQPLAEAEPLFKKLDTKVTPTAISGKVGATVSLKATLKAGSALVNGATLPIADPISGQPELKLAPVKVKRFAAGWYGFGLSLQWPRLPFDYWSRYPAGVGYGVLLYWFKK